MKDISRSGQGATSAGPGVVVENLHKSYGNFPVLKGISFSAHKGEIFGLIGPNGAGKTTTIKVLVGLIKDFQGRASVGGGHSGANKDRALGYLPQQAAFQDWRTVDQALSTFGRLSGMSVQEVEKRIPEVLQLLGIMETRNRKITQLSGGTIQKVGMAQAILHDPDFLVLDEPMAGLDPASRYQFKEVLEHLSEEGTTVLFSSHILGDVQDIADRIGIISHGTLMHEGTLDELRERLKVPKDIDVVLSKDSGSWRELRSLHGVTSIDKIEEGRIVVHLAMEADIDDSVDKLVRGLVDGGSKIRSIYPVNPNLEQLYVRFVTGGAFA